MTLGARGAAGSLFVILLLPAFPGSFARAANVEVGLELCDVPGGGPLGGLRVGLVQNAASVTKDGRRAVDVLRSRGVEVVRLFAPEHGLEGALPPGAASASTSDTSTGLEVVNLYGSKTRPSAADLRGLDALVVDLQDAGVRFYTYVSTLLGCIDAAMRAHLRLVVLDRPNPLGGELMEGPWADLPEPERSLVNLAPGPLVHGLTLGEMARFVAGESPEISVVPMRGWARSMRWVDTGRPWRPPSPNLKTAEAALLYPGVALLEGTNVSEGRGTRTPFLTIGAPFVSPRHLLTALEGRGVRLEETSFVAAGEPAAPRPRYEGELCRGLQFSVENPKDFRPYAFGVALLSALRSEPGFRLVEDGRALGRLLGTSRVAKSLAAGRTPAEILADDEVGLRRFGEERQSALLY